MVKEDVIMPISVVCSLFRSIPVTDVTMRQEVMRYLTKTQVKELLQKDVFTNAEKEILKVWYPTLFKLNNDELYKIACVRKYNIKQIMKVKNLTDEQFNHWFDKQIHVECDALSWNLVKWILNRKITDDQFSRLCQCEMEFNDKSEDFFAYSESLGYSPTTKDKYNVVVCTGITNLTGAPDYPMNDFVEYLVKLGSSKLCGSPYYESYEDHFWAACRVCEKYNTDFKNSVSFRKLMTKLDIIADKHEDAKELVLEMLDNNEISTDFLERTGLGQYVGLSSSEALLSNV